jgi:hypothetical protein
MIASFERQHLGRGRPVLKNLSHFRAKSQFHSNTYQKVVLALALLVADAEILDLFDEVIPGFALVDRSLCKRVIGVLDISTADVTRQGGSARPPWGLNQLADRLNRTEKRTRSQGRANQVMPLALFAYARPPSLHIKISIFLHE